MERAQILAAMAELKRVAPKARLSKWRAFRATA